MWDALANRLTRTAGDLAAVPIPGLEGLPGSALGALAAPDRISGEVRRLGTQLQDWICAARRAVDDVAAADDGNAARLKP